MKWLLIGLGLCLILSLSCMPTKAVLIEGYGLYGSKQLVTITKSRLLLGAKQTEPITIINGQDRDRVFKLSLQSPGGSLTDGYEALPVEYYGWFSLAYDTVKADKGKVIEVPVTLTIPKPVPNAVRGKKYDMRILVNDITQTGFQRVAFQEKWLITFAD